MGVVDGTTTFGDIFGAGPEAQFATAPSVVADPDRRSLVSATSTSQNRRSPTTPPMGHATALASRALTPPH